VTSGLEVDGLVVRLGELRLDVSISAQAGETIAVVGPNGAGKTTLLRALAGLVHLDDGSVVLDGQPLHELPPEERGVGFVFQEHLLLPHLTAVDNVAFGLRCRGFGRSAAEARARDWLDRVGLRDHARSKPAQLSGGQSQRVALARALATAPRLLLLDEPLAALDASVKPATRRDLALHLADHDGVRMLVTHDPVDAAALADRMVVLEAGRVVQTGTMADLTTRPASRYVADLVGVNLLRGRALGDRVDLGAFEIVIADRAEGDVHVVVPPRAITLSRVQPQGTARNTWAVRIQHLERSGDRVRVRFEIDGRPGIGLVAEVTALAVSELGLAPGTAAWAAVKATEMQVTAA
jgi:molybdate transport system ATP-binding protein